MGAEGAGLITSVGRNVSDFALGDRVAFFQYGSGYTSHAVVRSHSCFRIPDGLDDEHAVALLVQGFTAHYLACDTFPLQQGHACVVHAAAGGTGALLTQMAKLRGAFVVGTVSSEEKAAEAQRAGADAVVVYDPHSYDFLHAARAHAPSGFDVVYDSIGAATAEASLAALKPRGTCVFYGNASGPPPPLAPTPTLSTAGGGSLFITRPLLQHYLLTAEERAHRAAQTYGWAAEGRLAVRIAAQLDLEHAAEAHELLESRRALGKILLRAP